MKQKDEKEYYCENCFQEHLTSWKEQDDGTIVCSDKCDNEFMELKREMNKPKPKRRKK